MQLWLKKKNWNSCFNCSEFHSLNPINDCPDVGSFRFFFCKILCMIWLLAKSRLKIVNETIRWSNDVFKTLFYKLISVNSFRNGELLAPIPTFQLGFQKYFRFDIYFHIIDVLKQKVSLYKTAATICRYNKANIVGANIFLTEKKSIYKWININKFTNCYGV